MPSNPLYLQDAVKRFILAFMDSTNGSPMIFGEELPDGQTPIEALADAIHEGRVDRSIVGQDDAYHWLMYYDYEVDESLLTADTTFAATDVRLRTNPCSWAAQRRQWASLIAGVCHFALAPSASTPSEAELASVLADFETALVQFLGERSAERPWQCWQVAPDFLVTADGEIQPEAGKLAYFQQHGTNGAWLTSSSTHYVLLLLNAYPTLPPPHTRLWPSESSVGSVPSSLGCRSWLAKVIAKLWKAR